jgi:superfamily II DNA or RNA helicase
MELRYYQKNAVDEIYSLWSQGHQNILLQLATGGGKTVVFSHILANHRGNSIAIAHRWDLVSQISKTLAAYGITHNIIAQKATIREIVSLHMIEFKRSYYDPRARCTVASIDTLLRLNPAQYASFFQSVTLVVQDEGHHPLKNNKWGKVAELFPQAKGLYPTATPCRADGYGLGRHADGIIDAMVQSVDMRTLINEGNLSDYRIIMPPSNLDLSHVPLSSTGDYNKHKLVNAVYAAKITGGIVEHYLKFAKGKLGITFAVAINAAKEIASEFRNAGVSAEVISSKTPDLLRHTIMRKFRNREILQLVNVDLLGEGVDVPAVEVISMARPTQSYAVYAQQFGRALRPMPGKDKAIIIDHVDNVRTHKLPDAPRVWSLDRRARKKKVDPSDPFEIKICLNPECMSAYERANKYCPYCGYIPVPQSRSAPEFVDGDLTELDEIALAKLRGEIDRIDADVRIPQHLNPIAQLAVKNNHYRRQSAQEDLRIIIARWAGIEKYKGLSDSEIYRKFYFNFKVDIATAQTLGFEDAHHLYDEIKLVIDTGVNL